MNRPASTRVVPLVVLLFGYHVRVLATPIPCSCCTEVSIGDIGGFWYSDVNVLCTGSQDQVGVLTCLRLNYGTNPADSLALYVADSPIGPARKVLVTTGLSLTLLT